MSKNLIILLIMLVLITAGCTGNTKIKTGDGEVNIPAGSQDEWCQVGASWTAANPQTGESASMKITGTQTVDGVKMCKAVYESSTTDEVARIEYLWSENGESFIWTSYDSSGKIVGKMTFKDNMMTIIDETGKVTEIGGIS